MYLKLSTVCNYLSATPSSRCFVGGENVLEADHLISCGTTYRRNEEWGLKAFCIQSSGIKKEPHEITGVIKIGQTVELENFICTCAAGASGSCKHVAATLLFCTRKPINDLEELSSTDVGCLWKNKKPKLEDKYLPQPLKETPCWKTVMERKHLTFSKEEVEEIRAIASTSVPTCALSVHRTGRRQDIEEETHEIPPYLEKIQNNSENSTFMQQLEINCTVSNECCKQMVESFKADVILSGLVCKQGSIEWKAFRKNRITGSTCHTVYTFKKKDWTTMLKNFFNKKDVKTQAMAHGRKYEGSALAKFANQNPTYSVKTMGILICKKYPWLAYSPDGVVFENEAPSRLVEIKCPYLGKTKSIQEVIDENGLVYLNDDLTLKESHAYYSQIQLGMAILNLKMCDFIIFCSKDESYLQIIVPFNEKFADMLMNKISSKYFSNMLHYVCGEKKSPINV